MYFCVITCFILKQVRISKYTAKYRDIMIYARDALADLFALTRFLIPVAFTDIAVDVAEQVE